MIHLSPNSFINVPLRLVTSDLTFLRMPILPLLQLSAAVKTPLPLGPPNANELPRLPLSFVAIATPLSSSRELIARRRHARRELQREGVHAGVSHEYDDRHELTPHAKSHHLLRLLRIAIVE